MSYGKNLYIVVRGDKKAYKSADTPFWLWEEGAFFGFAPIFTVTATVWAVGSPSPFSIASAMIMWSIEIMMLNLHELYRSIRRKVYLRSGRILKVPTSLRDEFFKIIPAESYKVPKVGADTFSALREAFADFERAERDSPDRMATYDARQAAGLAQLRHILSFELLDRQARRDELEYQVTVFNAGQHATAQMYTDD